MKDKLIHAGVRVGLVLVKAMVLYLPDSVLGRIFRVIERLAYAFTGDRQMAASVAEVADIFETGPPFTPIVRKLIKGAEPEVVAGALSCLAKPSPYGAL